MFKNKWLISLLLILLLVVGMLIWLSQRTPAQQSSSASQLMHNEVKIKEHVFVVEVADTDEKRTQGLSGRAEIGADGMLFVFPQPGKYGFWMKDMLFDLDFIWMRDGEVQAVHEFVPHPTLAEQNLPVYQPPVQVDAMLEVPAGTIKKLGITVGDPVHFSLYEK